MASIPICLWSSKFSTFLWTRKSRPIMWLMKLKGSWHVGTRKGLQIQHEKNWAHHESNGFEGKKKRWVYIWLTQRHYLWDLLSCTTVMVLLGALLSTTYVKFIIHSPHLLVQATNERFLPAWGTFRAILASEGHRLQPMLVLSVHWWPAPVGVGSV